MSAPVFAKTLIGKVLSKSTPASNCEELHKEALHHAIAEAKAAFEAGNELGALDVWLLCKESGQCPTNWVISAMPIDAQTARHRKAPMGRHSRALTFTSERRRDFERYNAVLIALVRENLPREGRLKTQKEIEEVKSFARQTGGKLSEAHYSPVQGAFERAVELLSYRKRICAIDSVVRSYKRVKGDLKKGKQADYWYPSSGDLRQLMRTGDDDALLYYPGE